MSTNSIQQEILNDFEMLDTWEDKYEYIIDMGENLEPLLDDEKVDGNLVRGCQSKVWLVSEIKDDRLYLKADSDALITKGIVALLLKLYSGQTLEDIQIIDVENFLKKLELEEHLSPARRNGLHSMISKIKNIK